MGNIVVEANTAALDLLLEKVYRGTGHDFRGYKLGTVTRRLEGRLYATGTKTHSEYMRFLDTHPEEYQRLVDYLTICVSGFFRSSYTFQQVAGLVLPELVSHKRNLGDLHLRLWSTACAQGEEPYSIAILLADFLGNHLGDFDISIYATDINRQALDKAKAAIYSSQDVENLPKAVLKRYLTCSDKGYLVNSNIRQMVNFSYFDLVSTATLPFKNLDLVFCCNVLIYLQRQLQEQLLGMLYDALASLGYLILGEAETLTGNLDGKLECLNSKARIYKKKGGVGDA